MGESDVRKENFHKYMPCIVTLIIISNITIFTIFRVRFLPLCSGTRLHFFFLHYAYLYSHANLDDNNTLNEIQNLFKKMYLLFLKY